MIPEHFSVVRLAAFVTDLGDGALLIVLTALVALYLLLAGHRRGALGLACAMMLACGGIGLLKLLFLGCGAHFAVRGIHSPSGHAAMSVAAYITLAILLYQRLPTVWRVFPLILLPMLALLIGYTRVYFAYHTVEEVLLGILTGALAVGASWFAFLRQSGTPPFRARWAAALLIAIVLLLHGQHLQAEAWVRDLAARWSRNTPCAVETGEAA